MDQKTFEDLIDMFTSDGWALFIKGTEELEQAIVKAAPDGAITNDQWQFARGQVQQLRSVLGYENYVRLGYEAQERQIEEDSILDSLGDPDADTI